MVFWYTEGLYWLNNVGDNKVEVAKTNTYLGMEMSFSCSFKPAIDRLVDKASKAYYIPRQTFDLNNGCSPKVIQKLFNIMIVPILSYGAEIRAYFGWRRQEVRNIKQYIFNTRHPFEKMLI